MSQHFTFSMIKPEIVQAGQIGEIITQIEQNNFRILALRFVHLSLAEAEKFYEIHKDRPFYQELCTYMVSGPMIAMVLEKEDAVAEFRKLIGATNPTAAEEGTIRKRFGKSIEANAIHGSDSDENAAAEAKFFFPEL
jgi:nucleoside-diphosphate kinase